MFLLKNIKLIAAGLSFLAVLGFAWYVNSVIKERNRLRVELTQERLVNESNQRTLKRLIETYERQMDVLEQDRMAAIDRANSVRNLTMEIESAPETDDAPVAPVLARVLDSLRQATNENADTGSPTDHP